jgi:DNA-binding NarL/FixJ family response regulator
MLTGEKPNGYSFSHCESELLGTMTKLRILLADDHKLIREGLSLLINAQSKMVVIGEADNGRSAVVLTQQLQPHLVLMDVTMPELSGLDATKELRGLRPEIKILALTRHARSGYLQSMLEAGANGYALKQSASEELMRGIHAVVAGQTYVDPALSSQLVCKMLGKNGCRRSLHDNSLSPREEEVLRCVAWGFLSKEIAGRLDISIKTVEAHKSNAMQKMCMKGRTDIVRYALLRGWMEND